MARGSYSLSAGNNTVAGTIITLAFLNPKAAAPASSLEMLRMWISQRANATSAQQGVQWHSQVTAFPTLVTTNATLAKLGGENDAASTLALTTTGAAATAGVNASAEGAGTKTIIGNDSFNVLNGWLWVPTPLETVIQAAASASGFGMAFPAAPTTLTGWAWGVTWREV